MDIILNPTNKCNFNCTFCLARKLKNSTLSIDHTIKLLKKYEKDLNILIINGGDPLMMPPDYYEKLLEYLNTLDHKVFVSFTTNLLDWYLNPKKWHKILSNPNVGVLYSFSNVTGQLYSIIDTELASNSTVIINFLRDHYDLVSSDKASLQYCFATPDKSMVITTVKVSDSCFNINYTFVY